MVKEWGAAAQNRIGAVVERLKGWNQAAPTDPDEGDVEYLKGWNQAAPTDPDEGGGEQLGWQLAGQIGARIVPRQRRSRNMQGF
jgi:hypothetical protein